MREGGHGEKAEAHQLLIYRRDWQQANADLAHLPRGVAAPACVPFPTEESLNVKKLLYKRL